MVVDGDAAERVFQNKSGMEGRCRWCNKFWFWFLSFVVTVLLPPLPILVVIIVLTGQGFGHLLHATFLLITSTLTPMTPSFLSRRIPY